MDRQPVYIRFGACMPDGGNETFAWKAIRFGKGLLFWVMPLVLEALVPKRSNKRWKSNLALYRPAVQDVLAAMDLDEQAHWRASVYSEIQKARSTGKLVNTVDETAPLSEAFMLSTEALVVLISWLSFWSKERAQRARCRALLQAWLSKVVPLAARRMATNFPAAILELCDGCVAGSPCVHMSPVIAEMSAATDPDVRLLPMLIGCAAAASPCRAAAAIMRGACLGFAEAVDERVGDAAWSCDPLATGEEVVKREAGEGPCKRARIDKDFQRAVCMMAVASGKADTAQAFARAHGFCGNYVQRDSETYLYRYMTLTRENFKDERCISISVDGSRVGNPGEETETYAMAAVRANRACWLPPQAFGSHSRGGGISSGFRAPVGRIVESSGSSPHGHFPKQLSS